jgi:signal peptidase II
MKTTKTGTIALGAAVIIAVDELTKTLARILLPLCSTSECHEVDLAPWFGFVRMANGGSPLGFAQGLWLWTAIAVAGVLLVPIYARAGARRRWLAFAAALQLGGALGNLVDRVAFGGATDFLRIGSVVLNVSDLALVAGAVIGSSSLARLCELRPVAWEGDESR